MNSEQQRIRELAERIARRIDSSRSETDHRRVSKPQQSLSHVEPVSATPPRPSASLHGSPMQTATPVRSNWLSGTYLPVVPHPSQEKFSDLGEAVSELVDFFESEKTCSVEPGKKPCDHCGACSSRGF